MFLNFVGVNEKIVNLAAVVMIEDISTENEAKVNLITLAGEDIELVGTDAEALLESAQLMLEATDMAIAKLTAQQGA